MKKFLKWAGIILGSLILILIILVIIFSSKGMKMVNQSFEVTPASIVIPDDSAHLARGEYLVTMLCTDCHGDDLAGTDFWDDPKMGYMCAPNLTGGKGGIGSAYTDADWVRAIRHGVRPNGKGLMIMPIISTHQMGEYDLASVIAYLKTIPAVDKEYGPTKFKLMVKVLAGLGVFGDNFIQAALVDHSKGFDPIPASTDASFGEYNTNIFMCKDCHGPDLGGMPNFDPEGPFMSNITKGGNPGKWSQEDFMKTIRTGITPEGKELQKKFMPWHKYSQMSDEELSSIYTYIQSVPAVTEE